MSGAARANIAGGQADAFAEGWLSDPTRDHITDVATIENWAKGASSGQRATYCVAGALIRGAAADRARALEGQGLVRLHQKRREDDQQQERAA